MSRILLSRSLRLLDIPELSVLLPYIGVDDVDVDKVREIIRRVNRDLAGKGLELRLRKALPWDSKADYRIVVYRREV